MLDPLQSETEDYVSKKSYRKIMTIKSQIRQYFMYQAQL